MKNINTKVYCAYHDKKQLIDYNLKEDNILKLFYVKEPNEYPISKLDKYYCEFVVMYYIWKKQLKSDYIGFCHYQRIQIYNDVKKKIEELTLFGKPTLYMNIFGGSYEYFINERYAGFLYKDLIDYIKTNYKETDMPYYIFITNGNINHNWVSNECYACSWELFNELMDFIGCFIEYIDTKYDLNWDPNKYDIFIQDNWISVKNFNSLQEGEFYLAASEANKYRIFAYFIELTIGYYLGYYI